MRRSVRAAALAGVAMFLGCAGWPSRAAADQPAAETVEMPSPRWAVGAAAVYVQSPYIGQRGRLWGFPGVTYIGPRFRVVGPSAGVRLLQAGPIGVSVDARMRFSPFNERDGGQLQGMKSRRSTVEAGPRVTVFLPLRVRADVTISTDLLNEHGGVDTGVELSRSWRRGGWALRPALSLNHWSAGLADHYYGVRGSEASAGRPGYRPGAVWTPAADLALSRRLGADWSALMSVGVQRLGSAVIESPIVEERTTMRAMGAITYAF